MGRSQVQILPTLYESPRRQGKPSGALKTKATIVDIYLRLRTGKVHRTVAAHPDINFDLDKNGVILGAEILNAQELEIDGTKVSKTWVVLARMVSEMTP